MKNSILDGKFIEIDYSQIILEKEKEKTVQKFISTINCFKSRFWSKIRGNACWSKINENQFRLNNKKNRFGLKS